MDYLYFNNILNIFRKGKSAMQQIEEIGFVTPFS